MTKLVSVTRASKYQTRDLNKSKPEWNLDLKEAKIIGLELECD